MITLLDHLQLTMPPGEEDAARVYYTGLFGMTEEPKAGDYATRGGCWFRSGAVSIHLGIETERQPSLKAHVALCVDDLDTLAAALGQAGYPIAWEDVIPGRQRLYTQDPFGNRIELIQDGDGFSQRAQ